ncbi:MAG: prolyl oligopeptidase family serine peptidase [Verrucomicrobiota bacterium]
MLRMQRDGSEQLLTRNQLKARRIFVLLAFFLNGCTAYAAEAIKDQSPKKFFRSTEGELCRLSDDGLFVARFNHSLPGASLQIASTSRPDHWKVLLRDQADNALSLYLWAPDSTLIVIRRADIGQDLIHFDCNQLLGNGDSAAAFRCLPKALPQNSTLIGCFVKPMEGVFVAYLRPGETPGYSDVEAISLRSGDRVSLLKNNEELDDIHGISPDGSIIIGAHSRPDGGFDLLKAGSGKTTMLISVAYEETAQIVGFVENHHLLLASNIGKDVDKSRLLSVSFDDASSHPLDQDPLAEADISSVLLSHSGEVLGTTYITGRLRFYPKTENARQVYLSATQCFPDADICLLATDRQERFWLVQTLLESAPSSYHLWDKKLNQMTRLTSPEKYPSAGKTVPLRYISRDGLSITGYLTSPIGKVPSLLPTIVLPHGGPRLRTYWTLDCRVQFLASRGYAVFQPNYRGSKGFGKNYIRIANKQYGRAMQDDITDGVNFLIDRGISDPTRIGIFGGSYGGYCALSGLAFTPRLYAAGVSFFGISDLKKYVTETPGRYLPFAGQINASIGNPEVSSDSKMLDRYSPINSADSIVAPLLLYHGRHDALVPKVQSDLIFEKLTSRHHSVEYFVSQTEGHGFSDLSNEEALFTAVERFFSKHLGGTCSPEIDHELQSRLDKMRVDVKHAEHP